MSDAAMLMRSLAATFAMSIIIVIIGSVIYCYDGTYVETKDVQATVVASEEYGNQLRVKLYCEELDLDMVVYNSEFMSAYATTHIGDSVTVTVDIYNRFGVLVPRSVSHNTDENNAIVEWRDANSNIYQKW